MTEPRPCARPTCTRTTVRSDLCAQHMRAAVRAGERGRIDPTPVRNHITMLRQHDFSIRDIADLAGVSYGCVYYQNLRTRKKIHVIEARKILAVRPDAELPHRYNITMDASVGFTRRILALACIGWTMEMVADRAGFKQAELSMAIYRGRCSRAMFRAVAAVYDELSGTRGPSPHTETKALNKGGFPPMAWDNIDDPRENPGRVEPAGDVVDDILVARVIAGQADAAVLSEPEKVEAARRLLAKGGSVHAVAKQVRLGPVKVKGLAA